MRMSSPKCRSDAGIDIRRNTGRARAFRLTVQPAANDNFGLALEESYGATGTTLTTHVVTTTAGQTGRVIDAVLAAVRQSGHAPSVLGRQRHSPVRLDEAAGVRLALVLLTSQPMTRHDRVRALIAGLNAMSIEETYYWYAKTLGPSAARARKALRTLLTDL